MMAGETCKHCGDPVGFEHWDMGIDICPECVELEWERSQKRKEWEYYHEEPCPEIELPQHRKNEARDAD